MADKKVSELDAIAGSATAADDLFLIVDASGSVTKKITRAELNNAIEQDVLSTVDINGGTIDSTVIGGTTPAAGDFTTLGATGNITVGGTVDGRDVAADGTKLDGIATSATANPNAIDNVVEDTSPQLGGALDVQTHSIVSTSNRDITLAPNGTGEVTLSNNILATAGTTSIRPAGTEIVTINNTGDLTVKGQGSNRAMMLLKAGSNTANSQIRFGDQAADSAGRILYDHSSNFMRFDTNESERMRLTSAGLLGVNTTGPNAQVDIRTAALGTALQLSDDTNYGVNFIGVSGGLRMKMNGAQTLTIDQANNANVFHINGSGNVGINTASPNEKLTIDSGAISFLGSLSTPSIGAGIFRPANNTLAFVTGSSERARLDSNGVLLVGKTADSISNNGISAAGSATGGGHLSVTNDGNSCVTLNRKSSDGEIINFRKDGTAAGSIGVINNNNLIISNDADNSGLQFGSGSITPAYDGAGQDNSVDLGSSSTRFKDGYFSAQITAQFFTGVGDTDTYMDISSNPANTIKFFAGGAEKARISSNVTPKFFVGCTVNPSASVAGTAISTTDAGSFQSFAGATTTSTHAIFGNTNGAVGTIQTTNSTTAYNTSSDRRLKSNIEDAASASDKIDAIQVRQFDWNVDNSHQDYGLIAQELQPIEPLAVTGSADSDEMMGVDYSKLVPMLIKEIQELRSRVAALEAN